MAVVRILNAEPEDYNSEAREILKSFAQVDEAICSRKELLDCINGYDVLIVRLGHWVDRELLEKALNLKAIVTATTGLDHIDLEEAKRRNIVVLSLKGETAFLDTITATAEHTFALILALIRHIPWTFESVLRDEWDRDRVKGFELQGKTLGIIGFGRLGRMVGRYGLAFSMGVLTYDPHFKVDNSDVQQVQLTELLKRSDIVSLHVPLSPETENLIGSSEFSSMHCGAWLINTSRGEVIDEDALLKALESGHLGGAALDVLSEEAARRRSKWLKTHPLLVYARKHTNLLLTPHIGGATYDSMRKTEIFMARKTKNFFQRQMR